MKFFKRTDILVVLAFFAVALVIWLVMSVSNKDKAAVAEIYYHSKLVKSIDLSKATNETFSIPQNNRVVFHTYEDGSICFEQSDCPDKICVHTGRLHTVGQTAACIPNGIVLKIVPKEKYDKNDIDIIIG